MWWIFYTPLLYWVTAVVGLLTVAYKYFTWNFGFWEARGVPTPKRNPTVLMGHVQLNIFSQLDFTQTETNLYNEFTGLSFGGYYEFRNPAMQIRDPELIRKVLVKDYEYFADRRTFKLDDIYFDNMLSAMNGPKWKHLRSTMTPTFSSGKMRGMSELIGECGKEIGSVLEVHAENGTKIEMKYFFGQYALDVIATCAFGIQANSLKNPNAEFAKMAKEIADGRSLSLILLFLFMPRIMRLLRVSIVPTRPIKFFVDVVKSAMEYRETSGFRRNDFLQLMMDARTGKLGADKDSSEQNQDKEQFEKDAELSITADAYKVLTDEVVIANSLLFLVAGYDTASSALALTSYLLALNPECQDRLAEEVDQALEDSQTQSLHDVVQKIEYLDMVLMESIRIYSPAVRLERMCTQDYTIPGTTTVIPKGTLVSIPVYPIHHDEKYWPDPEKFHPERFSAENKAERSPYFFLPFGHGPKNCIGMRFALMEAKIALLHIVKDFRLMVCEKTQIPLKFAKKGGVLKPEDGIWLTVEKRH